MFLPMEPTIFNHTYGLENIKYVKQVPCHHGMTRSSDHTSVNNQGAEVYTHAAGLGELQGRTVRKTKK